MDSILIMHGLISWAQYNKAFEAWHIVWILKGQFTQKIKFSHNLLTLMAVQTFMTFFIWNRRYFEKSQSLVVHTVKVNAHQNCLVTDILQNVFIFEWAIHVRISKQQHIEIHRLNAHLIQLKMKIINMLGHLFSPSGNSSLSASTLVTVHILDVNDNSPVLVGDYSWKYLCTPRWEDQALVLASRDSDGPQHGGRLNFSLRSDATVRRNWKLTPINGLSLSLPTSSSSTYWVSWMWSNKSHLSPKNYMTRL